MRMFARAMTALPFAGDAGSGCHAIERSDVPVEFTTEAVREN